jgi:hypothetical protein
MNNDDLELKLLAGVPIETEVGKLHPLKLSEIMEIGEKQYNAYLGSIIISPKQLDIKDKSVKSFHLALGGCIENALFRKNFMQGLSIFFKTDVKLHTSGYFLVGDKILNQDNFDEIQTIIKKQNFISEVKDEFEKYKISDDEDTKRILEMRKKIKEKIKKENRDNGLNLHDVISIVASYVPNVNLFNVWDLTVYQLYTLYSRLMMKANYESNFAIYLQGEDPSKLGTPYWARKINY